MKRVYYTALIDELSASEGIFTTAQAQKLGIPRTALSNAQKSGRLSRIDHGAYRAAATQPEFTDELDAIWKLTAPSKMSYERILPAGWDGITVAGTTAASLLGIGDFYLTPYRILAPQRINSRNPEAHFGVRTVSREDVAFEFGFPVTKIERTLVDLILDNEEPSLIANAYRDARDAGLDKAHLDDLLNKECTSRRTGAIAQRIFG